MMRAQQGNMAAPFAVARKAGFLFRTSAMRRVFDALDHAFNQRVFPVILAGSEGIGKRTALHAWVEEARTSDDAVIALRADMLVSGDMAEAILAGFGLAPVPGSPAKLALQDYLEDCAEAGRRTAVLVTDLHRLEPQAVDALVALTVRRAQGGISLPLIATTDDVDAASAFPAPPLMLGGMLTDEIESLADQLFGGRMRLSNDAAEEIRKRTGGAIAKVGPMLDEAHARATGEGVGRISVRHLDDAEPAGGADAPEPERPEQQGARPKAIPTPDDIEKALLALDEPSQQRADEPAGTRAEPADERQADEDALDARLERSLAVDFPKIELRQPKLPEDGPANDPKAGLDPAVIEGLKGIAKELASLQGHLAYIRTETEALQSAAAERRRRVLKASEDFVKSLREPVDRASGE
ncbi:hypothetical protein [Parvularcula lutaonensis]|uniref:Uncharacterized protein n=1 Tax=Parvularcula lutaonensis TaxID=491923 RepID=A0ABV7MAY5_9PROT|nr:hypothetical protein [Parvularcula lutaonensis]GGY38975.1 hypothetical protein GCM10007148_04120 [Parvularcula lutaonensis]